MKKSWYFAQIIKSSNENGNMPSDENGQVLGQEHAAKDIIRAFMIFQLLDNYIETKVDVVEHLDNFYNNLYKSIFYIFMEIGFFHSINITKFSTLDNVPFDALKLLLIYCNNDICTVKSYIKQIEDSYNENINEFCKKIFESKKGSTSKNEDEKKSISLMIIKQLKTHAFLDTYVEGKERNDLVINYDSVEKNELFLPHDTDTNTLIIYSFCTFNNDENFNELKLVIECNVKHDNPIVNICYDKISDLYKKTLEKFIKSTEIDEEDQTLQEKENQEKMMTIIKRQLTISPSINNVMNTALGRNATSGNQNPSSLLTNVSTSNDRSKNFVNH